MGHELPLFSPVPPDAHIRAAMGSTYVPRATVVIIGGGHVDQHTHQVASANRAATAFSTSSSVALSPRSTGVLKSRPIAIADFDGTVSSA